MSLPASSATPSLKREVGVFGAVMMGLGSIVGTGVFVSIGIAAGAAGPAVVLAIVLAAVVATCNGLASAQLAANHPVSGGTFEYGYRWLTPSLGFISGWLFLCAKSASAATAALGVAGYALKACGSEATEWHLPLALVIVVLLTALVLAGIRLSSVVNVCIVSITLLALLLFVVAGVPTATNGGDQHLRPFFAPVDANRSPLAGFLEASALMFVAYTGYGRIATLGEEIRDPHRSIPWAITITLAVSMVLYVAVSLVAVASVGATAFSRASTQQAAPLEIVAQSFHVWSIAQVVAVGAIAAMLGVLLNLILGLSRVLLAMARRRDMPAVFAKIGKSRTTPYTAVVVVSLVIAALVLIGNVKTTWSFSAFTVLIYYALTNLAAFRLRDDERLYPRFISWLGLASCLFLAFWVEPRVWMAGLGLIAVGLTWHGIARWMTRDADT